jgi:hypothetical protein
MGADGRKIIYRENTALIWSVFLYYIRTILNTANHLSAISSLISLQGVNIFFQYSATGDEKILKCLKSSSIFQQNFMFSDFILVTERPLDNPKDEYTGMMLMTMTSLAYVY